MKKFLSYILIFGIISQLLVIPHTYADLNLNTFTINASSSANQYFNPGESFSFDIYAQNDIGEDIENVRIKLDFENNNFFDYSGSDQKTAVQFADVINPVPVGDYSSSTGLDTPISNSAITASQYIMFLRNSNAYSAFTISDDISTYSNTVTTYFEGEKVSDSSSVVGTSSSKTIYVNVKPHIVDKYFEKTGSPTTTIKGNGAESIDLIVEVKDYNGCTNIDTGTVTADLSDLGLSASESLTYDSCLGDGYTARFKKSGISTLASLGVKTFTHTDFSVTDEDGNSNDASDSNFVESGETDSTTLTVESPGAPDVTNEGITDDYIGGTGQTDTVFSFSATQSGTAKVAVDNCSQADSNLIFQDWTSYSGSTTQDVTIDSANLSEGVNTLFACVDNGLGDIGSLNFSVTKDTVVPTLSLLSHTANVTTGNVSIGYQCDEDGDYKIELTNSGGIVTSTDYTNTTANTDINDFISNSILDLGSNDITVYCRDNANNETSQNSSVSRQLPTPSMAGEVTNFIDNDIDNNGLNGIDILIEWNTSVGSSFSGFESWRIYILPSSTTLNTNTHNYIGLSIESGTGSFSSDASLTTDSAGDTFISGSSYKAYVTIMGTSGELGTVGESSAATLTADTIEQATVLSAEFISDTQLKLYTDTTLDTDLGSHTATGFIFDTTGSVTATAIESVSGQNMILTIPSLGDTATTGSNLEVATGAIHSSVGGFNDYLNPGFTITDLQEPEITNLSISSSADYGSFYSSSITIDWENGEDLIGGDTYLEFTRTSGNSDNLVDRAYITDPSLLASGTHSDSILINTEVSSNDVLLTCGTIYSAKIVGEDSAGNTANSNILSSIGFDNCAPSIPALNELTLQGESDFDLSWNSSVDDSGNGSGIASYDIEVYTGDDCSVSHQSFTGVTLTTQTVSLVNGDYSWKVSATDNIGNISNYSSCDNFSVDSDIPVISNELITDTVLSNTSYAKNGNTVEITADISNSDINNISANLASLTGNTGDTAVVCATPTAGITCNYSGGTATYSFTLGYAGSITEGVRQADIISNNTSGINTQNQLVSITVDKNDPVVNSTAITFPNGGETVGGSSIDITWNTGDISDTIGLDTVDIFYLKGGISQGTICSGANNGTCSWDLTSITTDTDYSIQITATDLVGNSVSDTSDSNFSVDKTAPVVPTNTLTTPNGGGIYAGGDVLNILWTDTLVTDSNGLATNPITLEYSSNNGSSYQEIISSEANDGSYNWTLPSLNTDQNFVKIIATDNVGNTAEDISDSDFIIDTTDPNLNISFAGNGGNTPQNGKYINNSGINLTLTTSDSYMENVTYTFQNVTENTYWDGSSFTGTLTDNTLCSDSTALGTDNSCNTIAQNISPTITHGNSYRMVVTATDEAGNSTTAAAIDYTGDTTDPTVTIDTTDGIYVSSNISLTGTSSDGDSGISSVGIQIKKGTDYWDGSDFVGSIQTLATTTSDSYATWSYDFTLPVGDSDGQAYEIIAIANDNAFKTNNSSTETITINKDSSGPDITTGTISIPNSGDIFSGGETMTINWSLGNITDSISGLDSNPIMLEYFDGSTYNTIASNLSNNGTYSWSSIASIDTNIAIIRITATDNAGNTSYQNSDSFTIDSTNPSISSIETLEHNISNGSINALKVIFSEDINDSSISYSDFSIDGGSITPTGISTGGSADDDEILLLFSETGTTGDTPSLRYTGTSIEDLAGRKLASTSTLSSIDRATPRMETIEIFDTDVNGKLDTIEITYSENLNSSTSTTGLTLNNPLSGMSIDSVSISTDTISIQLNESTNTETSPSGLSLSLSTPVYTDGNGNTVESFTSETLDDKALPIKLSTQTIDSDDNYKADQIILSFSENISGEDLSDFTIANLSTGTSVSGVSSTDKDIIFSLNETSDDNDTDNSFTVTYSGTGLQDSVGNKVNSISLHTSDDTLVPKILSRETLDSDANGQIDTIFITASENLNDDFSSVNISVDGYTINSYSTNTANDTLFAIDLEEKNTADTDVTPDIQVISNSSLGDTNGNLFENELSGTTPTDTAGPIIIGARYDEGSTGVSDDIIYLTFSEDIQAGSFDLSAGGAENDFDLTLGGAFAGNSTTSITSTTQANITLGAGATALTPGTSKIGIDTGALSDTNSNLSPTVGSNNRIIVSTSVIVNEVMFSTNTDNQYIELKNLGSASVDISGWVIENAGGNGVDLTISSGTIPGNSFYLIAKTSHTTSGLSVTADLVDATLSLNSISQNNLILTDSITTYDTVLAGPWPAGDNSEPKAMERKINPGNGTDGTNWYTAETSTGFDTTSLYGTPGIANVFDGVAPTIDAQFPADNTLLPTAGFIKFEYSDTGVGVDSSTRTISLQKWNGASYDGDTSGTDIVSSDVNNDRALFTLSDLDSGRYRTQFSVQDNAGNTVNKEIVFYIDKFSVKITGGNINMGDITPSSAEFSSGEITITVKTLGAGFDITQGKSGLFNQGIINIGDFDGSYGFGYDLYSDEDSSIQNYSSTISQISGGNIANITQDIQTDGDLKTYIYKIKYGVKTGGMQEPGKYSTTVSYETNVTY